jgi:hypothetical protein
MVATDARQVVIGLMKRSLGFELGSCAQSRRPYDLSFSVLHSLQPIIVTRSVRRPKQLCVRSLGCLIVPYIPKTL